MGKYLPKNSFLAANILIFILTTICLISPVPKAVSQEINTFVYTYGGEGDEIAYGVVETSEGEYIIAGYTSSYGEGGEDMWLVKLDATGNVLWNHTYGTFSDERAYAVIQTTDGGFLLAGSFFRGGGRYDIYLVKTDKTGNVTWNRTYPETEEAYAVVETPEGGYVVAGYTDVLGYEKMLLLKVDSTGNYEWSQTYGGINADSDSRAYSMVSTTNEEYILVGRTSSSSSSEEAMWFVKTDTMGNFTWNCSYGGQEPAEARSVGQTQNDTYIGVGRVQRISGGDERFHVALVTVANNGTIIKNSTYGERYVDFTVTKVVCHSDGTYLLGGTRDYGGFNKFVVLRVDTTGEITNFQTYGGSSVFNEGQAMIETSDGGLIMVGNTRRANSDPNDWFIVKASLSATSTQETSSSSPPHGSGGDLWQDLLSEVQTSINYIIFTLIRLLILAIILLLIVVVRWYQVRQGTSKKQKEAQTIVEHFRSILDFD